MIVFSHGVYVYICPVSKVVTKSLRSNCPKKRFRMWYDRSHLVHGAKVLLFPDEGAE